jgi:hypothetical protein
VTCAPAVLPLGRPRNNYRLSDLIEEQVPPWLSLKEKYHHTAAAIAARMIR